MAGSSGEAVAFDAYADETSSDDELVAFEVSASLLVAGDNMFAVSVHNRADSSSDLSFDLAASVRIGAAHAIEKGAAWMYYDGASEPSAQATSAEGEAGGGGGSIGWKASAFDDAGWSSGRAVLGYGYDDEATVLSFGADSNNKHPTAYFRHTVRDYALPNCSSAFELELKADDGAVVYINGVEVARHGIAPAPAVIEFGTYTDPHRANGDAYATFVVPASLGASGELVVAVEVHQFESSSSDLRFDLQLTPIVCEGGCTGAPVAHTVVREPYLQVLTSSSVIIRWDSDRTLKGRVAFGVSQTALATVADELTCVGSEHSVQLAALAPDTRYYYQIVGDDASVTFHFTTQKPATEVETTLLWFLADAGTANSYQEGVRDAYAAAGYGVPDILLFGGDNAYPDGTALQYEMAVFKMYPDYLSQTSAWSVLGNHDARSADVGSQSGVHFDAFDFPRNGEANRPGAGHPSGTEAYYSLDHGKVHLVVLDSESTSNEPGDAMAMWLAGDLAAAKAAGQQWIICSWHHPPYSKGSHNSDTSSSLTSMRENILPIVEAGGVDLVLTGHSHAYERSFVLDGHYGLSSTFDPATHVAQVRASAPATQPSGVRYHVLPRACGTLTRGRGCMAVQVSVCSNQTSPSKVLLFFFFFLFFFFLFLFLFLLVVVCGVCVCFFERVHHLQAAKVNSSDTAGLDVFSKPAGITPHSGTTYVVAGSAGALSNSGSLDHAAMAVSLRVRGSVVVEVSETVLDVKFVRDTAEISDQFRINKAPQHPTCSCSHGTAASGAACVEPVAGVDQCVACDAGYTRTSAGNGEGSGRVRERRWQWRGRRRGRGLAEANGSSGGDGTGSSCVDALRSCAVVNCELFAGFRTVANPPDGLGSMVAPLGADLEAVRDLCCEPRPGGSCGLVRGRHIVGEGDPQL
jgi:predicted MPP superfamily phosphohydrolase